jgi:hypothetical protein
VSSYFGQLLALDAITGYERKMQNDRKLARSLGYAVSMHGTVDASEAILKYTGRSNVWAARIPVQVTVQNANGAVLRRFKDEPSMKWQEAQGRWYVIEFHSGGDT